MEFTDGMIDFEDIHSLGFIQHAIEASTPIKANKFASGYDLKRYTHI